MFQNVKAVVFFNGEHSVSNLVDVDACHGQKLCVTKNTCMFYANKPFQGP